MYYSTNLWNPVQYRLIFDLLSLSYNHKRITKALRLNFFFFLTKQLKNPIIKNHERNRTIKIVPNLEGNSPFSSTQGCTIFKEPLKQRHIVSTMLKEIPMFFSFSIFRSLFFETKKTRIHVASGIVYIAGPYIVPNRQCDFKEALARSMTSLILLRSFHTIRQFQIK